MQEPTQVTDQNMQMREEQHCEPKESCGVQEAIDIVCILCHRTSHCAACIRLSSRPLSSAAWLLSDLFTDADCLRASTL